MEQSNSGCYHRPVLLGETLAALDVRPDGVYLDGTAGGGGHAFAIASRLKQGRLVALDQDPDAVAEASERLRGLPAVVIRSNFADMRAVLHDLGIPGLDGVLLDIGVSSHQLDTPERGLFLPRRCAFGHADEPERPDGGGSDRLAFGKGACLDLLSIWGGTVCPPHRAGCCTGTGGKAHCDHRSPGGIGQGGCSGGGETGRTSRTPCVSGAAHRGQRGTRPSIGGSGRRVRLFERRRASGGDHLHSLEDRLVKQRFAAWRTGCICPPDFPICVCGRTPAAKLVLRHPATASEQEVKDNPRSRSAKLRCIQKIHERYR